MALAGQALQTSYKSFSAINDADFKFGTILDGQGFPSPFLTGLMEYTFAIKTAPSVKMPFRNTIKTMKLMKIPFASCCQVRCKTIYFKRAPAIIPHV